LDILTPALPMRLPAGDHKYPTWIKWTKKIIVEEGHSLPQLIHIWQLVVRHPALFYSSSAQFVPQMVNSLNRIGLSPSCSVENRRLAVELAALIVAWEHQRVSAVRPKTDGKAADKPEEPTAGSKRTLGDDDAAAKRIKTEAGAVPVPAPAAPAAPAAGAAAPAGAAPAAAAAPAVTILPADDEFKPSAAIVEVVISTMIQPPPPLAPP
jgi:transformation/transcription domain-associated protein